ncbi:MAG: hypothetical protein RLN96_05215, partial [Pseudomonadales bacterium]
MQIQLQTAVAVAAKALAAVDGGGAKSAFRHKIICFYASFPRRRESRMLLRLMDPRFRKDD